MIWKMLHSWFFISRQSSHCVTQLLLHHSTMMVMKWLHILGCVHLGFATHSNTLLQHAGSLPVIGSCIIPWSKCKVHTSQSLIPLQSLSWANAGTNQPCSITWNWNEVRERNWRSEMSSQWDHGGLPSSNEPALQTGFTDSYIYYLFQHSWCILLS